MPAFTTHVIFGEEVIENIQEESVCQAVKEHLNIFHAGCQGPDLFFYNPLLSKGSQKKNLGSRMHEERTNRFFACYLRQLSILNDKKKLETGISYLLGFLSHYTLDSVLHPFIYGRVGYETGNPLSSRMTLGAHHRLEAVVDKKMLMAKKQKMPSEYNPAKQLIITGAEREAISSLLAESLTKTFLIRVKPSNIKASYGCMKLVVRMLQGNRPAVKQWVGRAEKKLFGEYLLSNLMVDDELEDKEDAFNSRGAVWTSPWEKDMRSRKSIWELYDIAMDCYQNYYQALRPVLTAMLLRITILEKFPANGSEVLVKRIQEQIPAAVKQLENRTYHSGKRGNQ